jgi:hypothetical protein
MVLKIFSLTDLMQALEQRKPQIIEIHASIVSPHSIVLPEGFSLRGGNKELSILSFSNGDGIGIKANNTIADLTILTRPDCRAVYFQTGLPDMGTITLRNLIVAGQVSLIIRTGTQQARVDADHVDVIAADARKYSEQPQKYGVNVYQGAFTLYNFNGDPASKIHATLTNITAGRRNAPVYGSGIFISGFGDNGGYVLLEKLSTGAVYSHGLLPYGTADMITGGVFINYGVKANKVENNGEIVTYGVNDMVLDNWGEVTDWSANEAVTSYGPSGIGFVNFGVVQNFVAKKPIVTHGLGARGFNQYDGTVQYIKLKSIRTFGDGSIGIQISKPVGHVELEDGITTKGSIGDSLVKGVLTKLSAVAFSIRPGGEVQSLTVNGDIRTSGDGSDAFVVEGGELKAISVTGEIRSTGKAANAVVIRAGGTTALTNVRAVSTLGKALINEDGVISDQEGFQLE